MVISREACSEIVRLYDSQGWHRTATEVDNQSGQWLIETLSTMGLEASAVPFPFSRIDASECFVSAGSFRVDAVHLVDSGLPPSNTTIRGVFGPGDINLVRAQSHGVAAEFDGIRGSDCKAIVVAVAGPSAGITLLNAWNYDNPGGVPIVQVPETAWQDLVAARDAGVPVEVRCGGTRTATTGVNVRAAVPGKHRALAGSGNGRAKQCWSATAVAASRAGPLVFGSKSTTSCRSRPEVRTSLVTFGRCASHATGLAVRPNEEENGRQ